MKGRKLFNKEYKGERTLISRLNDPQMPNTKEIHKPQYENA